MYAKFVKCDESDPLFNGSAVSDRDGNRRYLQVPDTSELFEGPRMIYRKVSVSGAKEFEKITKELPGYTLLTGLTGFKEDKPFEFIFFQVYKDTPDHAFECYIAGEDSVLFIMNDQGKTIDKIACRNIH